MKVILYLVLKQVKPSTSRCRFIWLLWGETACDSVSYFLFIFVFSIRRPAVELPRRPGAVKKVPGVLQNFSSNRTGSGEILKDGGHKARRTMMRWCWRESNKEAAAGSRFELSHWHFLNGLTGMGPRSNVRCILGDKCHRGCKSHKMYNISNTHTGTCDVHPKFLCNR